MLELATQPVLFVKFLVKYFYELDSFGMLKITQLRKVASHCLLS